MPPSRWRASLTESPSARLACFAITRGIRTAKLFPHFAILDSFRICLYFEYTLRGRGLRPPGFDVRRGVSATRSPAGGRELKAPGLPTVVIGLLEPEVLPGGYRCIAIDCCHTRSSTSRLRRTMTP